VSAPVSVGLNISALTHDAIIEGSRAAEAAGYESVWLGEHFAIVDDPDWWRSFPGALHNPNFGEDMLPFAQRVPWPDSMIMLGALSAATKSIRLGLGIYMLAVRHPIFVAKALATLDNISGGRIDLAVGLGWSPEEYAMTGVSWETRGRRTNEALEVLKVLFEDPRPEHHGEFFDIPKLASFGPQPVQRPFPVHIGGGGNAAALKRAAKYGVGWYGGADVIPELKRLLVENGRGMEGFQFSTITMAGPLQQDALADLAAQGVHRVVVTPWAGVKSGTVGLDRLDEIKTYAQDLGLSPR
jgi:probable F420-dependent oxidoreductase